MDNSELCLGPNHWVYYSSHPTNLLCFGAPRLFYTNEVRMLQVKDIMWDFHCKITSYAPSLLLLPTYSNILWCMCIHKGLLYMLSECMCIGWKQYGGLLFNILLHSTTNGQKLHRVSVLGIPEAHLWLLHIVPAWNFALNPLMPCLSGKQHC